jgi:hypothetical protein
VVKLRNHGVFGKILLRPRVAMSIIYSAPK